jgi:hypothetical protein
VEAGRQQRRAGCQSGMLVNACKGRARGRGVSTGNRIKEISNKKMLHARRNKSKCRRRGQQSRLRQQHGRLDTTQGPRCTSERLPYPPQSTRLAPNSPQKNRSIGQSRPQEALNRHAN